jgi:hypothetical protein
MRRKAFVLTICSLVFTYITTFGQIQDGGEYTIAHIEQDQYFGTLSAGAYNVQTGFGYTNKNCIFIFEEVSDGIYKIKAKTSGKYIRASEQNNQGLSAKNQTDDDYAKFKIEKHDNGAYAIQVVANNWNWKYNASLDQLQVRKSNYKQDYFIISKYEDPTLLQTVKTLKQEVKIRNLSNQEYLAFDIVKGGPGPLKLGGYFEEYASWKVNVHPNGKVTLSIANDVLLAKRQGNQVLVSKGKGSKGSPDAIWKLVQVDAGIMIKHTKTHTFLAIDTEGGITLTTKMEDPRAIWQLDQKEVRMESAPKGNQEVLFGTFLNGGFHFGFSAFEYSPVIAAQKTLRGAYSNWEYISVSSSTFKLQNKGNDKFLSVVEKGDGHQLQLTDDLQDQSTWSIKKLAIGGFELKNKATGFFIQTLDDGNVLLDDQAYGQWFFEPVKEITSEILSELE